MDASIPRKDSVPVSSAASSGQVNVQQADMQEAVRRFLQGTSNMPLSSSSSVVNNNNCVASSSSSTLHANASVMQSNSNSSSLVDINNSALTSSSSIGNALPYNQANVA